MEWLIWALLTAIISTFVSWGMDAIRDLLRKRQHKPLTPGQDRRHHAIHFLIDAVACAFEALLACAAFVDTFQTNNAASLAFAEIMAFAAWVFGRSAWRHWTRWRAIRVS